MENDKLIAYYETSCRWCKDYRGKGDPIVCDSEEPCLNREDLAEMRKLVKELEE